MEPIDLAAKRAQHRQRLRDDSSAVLVALPADGGLARALADVEEVLLLVDLAVQPDDEPLPVALAEREAADAVGRLAGLVATVARAVEEDRPLVQPIAPDGQFELVPVCIVHLGREDRARIVGAVQQLAATRARGSHPAVDEAVSDYTGDPQAAEQLVATAQRLAALLELTWDDDVDVLNARLGKGVPIQGETQRVVLTAAEYGSYQRVTERIFATWHAGDPLERFLYRG